MDAQTCISLIMQVSGTYLTTILNVFCTPFPLLMISETGQVIINPKLARTFSSDFVNDMKGKLRLLGHLALPEQKQIESDESHLMQKIAATEEIKLFSCYL